VADGLADDEPAAHIEPAPRTAVYAPPAPGSSHPRHAILGPALRLDEAERSLQNAALEVTLATRHLRACELAEADAEASLMVELPAPTQDEALRAYADAALKQRAENISKGLDPNQQYDKEGNPAKPGHGKSPIDQQAAARMRNARGVESNPLRSAVVRRRV